MGGEAEKMNLYWCVICDWHSWETLDFVQFKGCIICVDCIKEIQKRKITESVQGGISNRC
jgi:hypothetical protein